LDDGIETHIDVRQEEPGGREPASPRRWLPWAGAQGLSRTDDVDSLDGLVVGLQDACVSGAVVAGRPEDDGVRFGEDHQRAPWW